MQRGSAALTAFAAERGLHASAVSFPAVESRLHAVLWKLRFGVLWHNLREDKSLFPSRKEVARHHGPRRRRTEVAAVIIGI